MLRETAQSSGLVELVSFKVFERVRSRNGCIVGWKGLDTIIKV